MPYSSKEKRKEYNKKYHRKKWDDLTLEEKKKQNEYSRASEHVMRQLLILEYHMRCDILEHKWLEFKNNTPCQIVEAIEYESRSRDDSRSLFDLKELSERIPYINPPTNPEDIANTYAEKLKAVVNHTSWQRSLNGVIA